MIASGRSSPSLHSTVTRLLARLTRAPRTPLSRPRPFSIVLMQAPQWTPSTTRSIAATPSAGWRTKWERSCVSLTLDRSSRYVNGIPSDSHSNAYCICVEPLSAVVIASDSEAIQTKPPPQSLSLDCFALLAMTSQVIRPNRVMA